MLNLRVVFWVLVKVILRSFCTVILGLILYYPLVRGCAKCYGEEDQDIKSPAIKIPVQEIYTSPASRFDNYSTSVFASSYNRVSSLKYLYDLYPEGEGYACPYSIDSVYSRNRIVKCSDSSYAVQTFSLMKRVWVSSKCGHSLPDARDLMESAIKVEQGMDKIYCVPYILDPVEVVE